MSDQAENGRRPGWEVFEHPVHGRVSQWNFAINHPPEDETKYAGLFVAYTLDGYTALAAAKTLSELGRIVEGLGVPGDQWMADYYDRPNAPPRMLCLEIQPVRRKDGATDT